MDSFILQLEKKEVPMVLVPQMIMLPIHLNYFHIEILNAKKRFQAFEDAISWAKTSINEQHLEEAILGVVSSIDKPLSPVGEAKNDFNFNLEDINIDDRLAFRQRIINCSIEDLVRVNEKYLTKESKRSILAGESFKDQAKELKLEILEV